MVANDSLDTKTKGKSELEKPRSRVLLWVLVFTMSIFLVSLTLIASTIEGANFDLVTELDAINQSLAITPAPNPTEMALNEELLNLRAANAALDLRLNQLQSSSINWPSIMMLIASYDVNQMQIVSLVQDTNHLSLIAHAQDETVISNYVDNLRNSASFTSVNILHILLKTPQNEANSSTTPSNYLEFILSLEIEVGHP